MRDDELAAVEHDVADEPVEEVACPIAELVGLQLELLQSLARAVGDLHVAAPELAHQLDVVVAWQTDRRAGPAIAITSLSTAGVSGPRSP